MLEGKKLDLIEGLWFSDGLGTVLIFKDQENFKMYIVEGPTNFNGTLEATIFKRGNTYDFIGKVWYQQMDGSYKFGTQGGRLELSGNYFVYEEGELLLPRLDETFVRGLTKSELKTLLEKRYAEFLIDPEIKIRIAGFKSIRVLARGELRNPGFYKFPAYASGSFAILDKGDNSKLDLIIENNNEQSDKDQNLQSNNQSSQDLVVKRSNESLTTISVSYTHLTLPTNREV